MTEALARKLGISEHAEKAVEEYNKYRSPEATAKLLRAGSREIVVEFVGPFCVTCGTVDWVDDMRFVLEDLGVRAKISKLEEVDGGFVATFEVEEQGEP